MYFDKFVSLVGINKNDSIKTVCVWLINFTVSSTNFYSGLVISKIIDLILGHKWNNVSILAKRVTTKKQSYMKFRGLRTITLSHSFFATIHQVLHFYIV